MTPTEHVDTDHVDRPRSRGWRPNTSEKAAISTVAGLVGIACALGPYISPGTSGIATFGASLGVSVAGGLLVIVAVRIFTKKIVILLLPAVAALACAGLVGGVIGYLLPHAARVDAGATPPTDRTPSSTRSATSVSRTASGTERTYTEIADNRNGVPVFRNPDGSSTDVADIPFATHVKVVCYAPNESGMTSINAFYLVKSPSPWKSVYAPANTFANGDPVGESGSTNIDPAVPPCPVT